MKLQRVIKLDKKDMAKILMLKESDIEGMYGFIDRISIRLKEKDSRIREKNNTEKISGTSFIIED